MYKSEGLQQPEKNAGNKRIIIVLIAVLVVAVSVFTVRVIGDENDGIDHTIQYSNKEIWELTYQALGVDPYDESDHINTKATAPLGSSSNVMITGNKELDHWINKEVAGTYLLDIIREEDGCEALLVMDPDENQLSIIALNLEDDFHTFNMKITNPEPLSADIQVYKVEEIELGTSLGASGEAGGTRKNKEQDELDTSSKIEAKKSDIETKTENIDPNEELPSIGDFQGLLDPTGTGIGTNRINNEENPSPIGDLLVQISSEQESEKDNVEAADSGGTPVKKEVYAIDNSDKALGSDEQAKKDEAPNAVDSSPTPVRKEDLEKEILEKEETSVSAKATDSEEESIVIEPSSPPEKKPSEDMEAEEIPLTPPKSEANDSTTGAKEEANPSLSIEEKNEKTQKEEEISVKVEEEKKADEFSEKVAETKEKDLSINEDGEIEKFQEDTFENPKNGVLVSVPSNGVAVAKITINDNLLRLADKGFTVQDGEIFILEKNSSTKASYLTRGRDDHKLRFGVEEDTKVLLNGTGTEKITLELNTDTSLTVGQIIANVDTLYISPSAEITKKRTTATGEESHLIVDSLRITDKEHPDGISGSKNIEFSGNITVNVLSEEVGGSGISASDSVVIEEKAAVTTEGESFGLRIFGEEGNLSVHDGSLTAIAQPSRSNKGESPVVGVFASGTLDFTGGSLSSTVVQSQTMPQDDIIVRKIDDIHGEAKTFAYHVNDASLITQTGAKLEASGGDVGICVENTFLVEGNANIDVTAYWAGMILNGSNAVVQSDNNRNAPKLNIIATGKTAGDIPYGYGILVRDSLDFKKKIGSYVQGSVDHYRQDTAPKVEIDATQVGIYVEKGNLSSSDGTSLKVSAGVTGEYIGKTPVPVPNTYGVYLDEKVMHFYIKYNGNTEVLSGFTGIFCGYQPTHYQESLANSITVENSASLKAIGNYAGIGGNMQFFAKYSAYIILHGNNYGGLLVVDSGSFRGASYMVIGAPDENEGATRKNTIFHATAVEGIGISASSEILLYDSIYALFQGDTAGLFGYHFSERNWYGGEAVVTAKTKAYANNNPLDEIPASATPIDGFKEYPVRKEDAMAIDIRYWREGGDARVLEIYEGKDSGYGWYNQAMSMHAHYNGIFEGMRKFFNESDTATAYNWSYGTESDYNKLQYIDPETIPTSDVDNFEAYSYMQMDNTLIPHDDDEFRFQRYSQGTGAGVRTIRGVGLFPQKNHASAMIIGDTEDTLKRKTVPGWSNTSSQNHSRFGIGRHRIILLDTDVYATPEGNLHVTYASRKTDGTEWRTVEPGLVQRENAQFKMSYLPLDAPPNTPKIESTVRFFENTEGKTKHIFDRMPEGYYWLEDIDIPRSNYDAPTPAAFKIYSKKIEDGLSDEFPYYVLTVESLDDPPNSSVVFTNFVRGQHNTMVDYGPDLDNIKDPPHGFSSAYNDFPRFDSGKINLAYGIPTFRYRFEARLKVDSSVKIPGTVEAFRLYSTEHITAGYTYKIPLSSTHSLEDNLGFQEIPKHRYEIRFIPDNKDYLPSEITHTNTLNNIMTGTAGAGDQLVITPTLKSYRGDLTFNVRLYQTDVDLKTVMGNDTVSVPAFGAEYLLTEYYKGVATSMNLVPYKDDKNTGTISLKDIKIDHEYTLRQTLAPTDADDLDGDPVFRFKIATNKNANGDIIGKVVVPIGTQPDPWIGLAADDFVTIKNKGEPFFDFQISVRAHGLWEHHGENSFTVKLEEKAPTGQPARVYYKNIDFIGRGKDDTIYHSCPLFSGVGNPNDEAHISICEATETEIVTFENVVSGTYNVTVLSPLRFEDSAVVENLQLPQVPPTPVEITVVGKRQEYLSNGTHTSYNFTIS